jgi:hypothetical protein
MWFAAAVVVVVVAGLDKDANMSCVEAELLRRRRLRAEDDGGAYRGTGAICGIVAERARGEIVGDDASDDDEEDKDDDDNDVRELFFVGGVSLLAAVVDG